MAFWDFITDALSYRGEALVAESEMQQELAVLINNKIAEWDNEGVDAEIPDGLKESANAMATNAPGVNGVEIDPNEFINQFGEHIE